MRTDASPGPRLLQAQDIENFYQVSSQLYSGSSPETDEAFSELQKRGVKTIISVDGAKPDVEMAKKHGIRYVHLPVGYDGIPADQAVRLVKAAKSLPSPIYVHCHHGMHRGPAATAIICQGINNWTPEQAVSWLRLAGTSTNYVGLYKSVAQFVPPTVDVLNNTPDSFPEISQISGFVDAMVEIDKRFDRLKLIKEARYSPLQSHPDIDPQEEALLFDELFKEMLRSPETQKRDEDLLRRLEEAERAAYAFNALCAEKPFNADKADIVFQRISDSCAACHKAHRN